MSEGLTIEDALEDLAAGMKSIGNCGDGNCIIYKPIGQHTNGGCRCASDRMRMQKYSYYHNRFAKSVSEISRANEKGERE